MRGVLLALALTFGAGTATAQEPMGDEFVRFWTASVDDHPTFPNYHLVTTTWTTYGTLGKPYQFRFYVVDPNHPNAGADPDAGAQWVLIDTRDWVGEEYPPLLKFSFLGAPVLPATPPPLTVTKGDLLYPVKVRMIRKFAWAGNPPGSLVEEASGIAWVPSDP